MREQIKIGCAGRVEGIVARPCPLRAAGICSSARHPLPAVLLRLWDSVWYVAVWLCVCRAVPWGGTNDGRAGAQAGHTYALMPGH